MIKAKNDAKGLGNAINAIAGTLIPCTITLKKTGEKLECNSTWAATDWLTEHGYLESHHKLTAPKELEYELSWPKERGE